MLRSSLSRLRFAPNKASAASVAMRLRGGAPTTPRAFATQSDSSTLPPTKRAKLILEDGSEFPALSFGADTSVAGEIVFSTGMVGYPESLTDPSYRGQLLTLTYPMVGNYGVPDPARVDASGLPQGFESDRIHASALIVQDYSHHYSHWDAKMSLGDWLKQENIPGLCGLDTRALTKKIRDKGAMLARIELEGDAEAPTSFADPNARNLVAEVSVKEPVTYGAGNPLKILAVDCGIKANIVRQLVDRGAEVKVVPYDHDLSSETDWYDGLFISNGPGDPTMCSATIDNLRKIIDETPADQMKPIFGICLGNQLVGLAAGATSSKLPFGNRGQNQPVMNSLTGECFITPQNHGYAIDSETLPAGWSTLFSNANDGSNEGIMHDTKPIFTAQFHPEAMGGPTDTQFLFDVFLNKVTVFKEQGVVGSSLANDFRNLRTAPPRPETKKVLVLGSGGLSIGQAGEFDYSGSQAIKALKEEGHEIVLMNPNIASVQTNADEGSIHQADQVYFLPVNEEFVEQVIKRERPDSILLSMGGQTGLNCGVSLWEKGILEKYGVQVLGTQVEAIVHTEDRQLFSDKLNEIDEKIAQSVACDDLETAVEAANTIGYPIMIRSAFALGGLGSGLCRDEAHLRDMASKAFSLSPQILVEKSLRGWKEVEYEVVRDAADNCITVCNMENFDPLGVHTGDSIVIAPSQTLSNEEYHMLRETALRVVRHLGIIGECNIQYALDPKSLDYCIIEVNARLSRSSALASKATGYPLAFVAAKLGLGMTLPEIDNAITKKTQACFEPSLDYVVTKIPRWDLSKFEGVSTEIGSAMKSVGEVMSIGRTWEESMQKAMRMVDPGVKGFEPRKLTGFDHLPIEDELVNPSDRRIFRIAQVLSSGEMSVDDIHDLTAIDHWFLRRLERIVHVGNDTAAAGSLEAITKEQLLLAKQMGFSDAQIAGMVNAPGGEDAVRARRLADGIRPWVKQIDTLAAEYPAQTNFLYVTYHGSESDIEHGSQRPEDEKSALVMGSGAYRIGSSVEFDWCAVSCVRGLRNLGYRAVMLNYNPETVSTDYDECDQLYFEELSKERVLDIVDQEQTDGVVVSVGGQIPNNIALPLHKAGVNIFGTSPEMIDRAEDRFKFSAMLDKIGVQQPAWRELTDVQAAHDFAEKVGYPVLVRPSYVLSGAAMNVAYTREALEDVLGLAAEVSAEHPVVITKFVEGAREIEMDAVAQDGKVVCNAISEHVENAGVHSGDATLVLPAQQVSNYTLHKIRTSTEKIAKELNITGPFNMQFVCKDADVMVIECNLRASRSFPFVSKTMGVDFINVATKAMAGVDIAATTSEKLPQLFPEGDEGNGPSNFVGVKAPMFSFTRLRGADPVLGVEMASTGEVACFGADLHEAFLKALLSTGFKLPEKRILISAQDDYMDEIVHTAWQLHELGYELLATDKTHENLAKHGVPATHVHFPLDAEQSPNALSELREGKVDLVVNLPNYHSKQTENNFLLRRTAVDYGVPLLTNVHLVKLFADAMSSHQKDELVGLKADNLFDYYEGEATEEVWTDVKEFH